MGSLRIASSPKPTKDADRGITEIVVSSCFVYSD